MGADLTFILGFYVSHKNSFCLIDVDDYAGFREQGFSSQVIWHTQKVGQKHNFVFDCCSETLG